MMRHLLRFAAAALAALLFAAAAHAQPMTAPAPSDQAEPAPIDPARLEAARLAVGKLVPEGTMMRMMGEGFETMFGSMAGAVDEMPIQDFARMAGIDPGQAMLLGEGTLGELMAIYDPDWKERATLGRTALMRAMGELMNAMEPRIKEAMARAYARHFTLAELTELNIFFATPTGARFASTSTTIAMDPEIATATAEMMPEVMRMMPGLMETAAAATAHLPEPRTFDELSDAERQRLSELLGVPLDELGRDGLVADIPVADLP